MPDLVEGIGLLVSDFRDCWVYSSFHLVNLPAVGTALLFLPCSTMLAGALARRRSGPRFAQTALTATDSQPYCSRRSLSYQRQSPRWSSESYPG